MNQTIGKLYLRVPGYYGTTEGRLHFYQLIRILHPEPDINCEEIDYKILVGPHPPPPPDIKHEIIFRARLCIRVVLSSECSNPVGFQDHRVRSDMITSSSDYFIDCGPRYRPWYARLHSNNFTDSNGKKRPGGWVANSNDFDQWFQVAISHHSLFTY